MLKRNLNAKRSVPVDKDFNGYVNLFCNAGMLYLDTVVSGF